MTSKDSSILFSGPPSDERVNPEHIKKLRDVACQYRDKNNALVNQIWALEMRLGNPQPGDDSDALMKEKAELSAQIAVEAYAEKVQDLIQEIKRLEIALYGHSEVDSDSPGPGTL